MGDRTLIYRFGM